MQEGFGVVSIVRGEEEVGCFPERVVGGERLGVEDLGRRRREEV